MLARRCMMQDHRVRRPWQGASRRHDTSHHLIEATGGRDRRPLVAHSTGTIASLAKEFERTLRERRSRRDGLLRTEPECLEPLEGVDMVHVERPRADEKALARK